MVLIEMQGPNFCDGNCPQISLLLSCSLSVELWLFCQSQFALLNVFICVEQSNYTSHYYCMSQDGITFAAGILTISTQVTIVLSSSIVGPAGIKLAKDWLVFMNGTPSVSDVELSQILNITCWPLTILTYVLTSLQK